jgi:hypothetical protein
VDSGVLHATAFFMLSWQEIDARGIRQAKISPGTAGFGALLFRYRKEQLFQDAG